MLLYTKTNIFLITSCLFLLRMKNVSDRVLKNIKTHFMPNKIFTKILPFKRQCGKNNVERGRPPVIK